LSNLGKKTLFKILGFFCLVLILPFPTGFYYLFRVVVFVGAIYAASEIRNLKSSNEETIYLLTIAIAFIYNPILMVFLYQKAIWIVTNILSGIVFFKVASLFQTEKKQVGYRNKKPIFSEQILEGQKISKRVKTRSKNINDYHYELKMNTNFSINSNYMEGEVVRLNRLHGIFAGEVLSWDTVLYVLRLKKVDIRLLKGDILVGEGSGSESSIIQIDPIEKKVNINTEETKVLLELLKYQ